MTQKPINIAQRRPNRSFRIGTKGKLRMAPSEYEALMKPDHEPAGSLKSTTFVSVYSLRGLSVYATVLVQLLTVLPVI